MRFSRLNGGSVGRVDFHSREVDQGFFHHRRCLSSEVVYRTLTFVKAEEEPPVRGCVEDASSYLRQAEGVDK